jgi:hypothetical protein
MAHLLHLPSPRSVGLVLALACRVLALSTLEEADPNTNLEPLPAVFYATVQFLGVSPQMGAVHLSAPGVNSSIPSMQVSVPEVQYFLTFPQDNLRTAIGYNVTGTDLVGCCLFAAKFKKALCSNSSASLLLLA